MYGYSPSSLRSLLRFPKWSPTTPLGASQTCSYPRVLCHPSGAPGAPPALPECFPSSLYSSFFEGASSTAGSARLGPPVLPSFVVFHVMFLESLFFLGAFVFLFRWSVCLQLGHMGYSPYPDVSGGIRLLCDSARTSHAQHGLYRCHALQHSAFSYDHVPDHGHLHRGGERGDSSDSGVPLGTRDQGEDSGATSNSVGV